MRSTSASVGGLFALLVVIAAAHAQPRTPRQALEENHPGVRFHEQMGRVRTVYGARMTAGATPREAAENWLGLYDGVFAGGLLELEEVRAMPLSDGERTVFMYRQTMDGLPVVGSTFRLMTFGHAPSRAVYAGARVAIRPHGGLPEPTVTPAEATAAAQAHPMGQGLTNWGEPELVAIYDDVPAGDAVAFPAWRCVGTRARPYDSRTLYVHALTGEVSRHHSNISHARDITGTVSGKATPADTISDPEALGPDTSTPTTNCPNDEETVFPPHVLIEAFQGQTLVAAAETSASGGYTLNVQNQATVDIHASLIGPGWEVMDGSEETWGEPLDPLVVTNVTAPASGVNFSFNSTPTEAGTAFLSGHVSMARTMAYLELEVDSVPTAPIIGMSNLEDPCPNGFFIEPSAAGNPPWPGVVTFLPGSQSCQNSAYSTIIAHEYGHFLAFHLLGIETGFYTTGPFHEGFSDTLAHLVFDTPVYGQDWAGCGNHSRRPLVEDPSYPVCPVSQFNPYDIGMLLSALWLDIRNALGVSDTGTLYRDWIGLAQLPGDAICTIPPHGEVEIPQAADEGTLIEVLTADSPDGDPANAPHLTVICQKFQGRLIGLQNQVCNESAGGWTYADCDRSDTLDVFDFLCFQNEFAAGGAFADCDRDGHPTVLDFLCFQKEYTEASR